MGCASSESVHHVIIDVTSTPYWLGSGKKSISCFKAVELVNFGCANPNEKFLLTSILYSYQMDEGKLYRSDRTIHAPRHGGPYYHHVFTKTHRCSVGLAVDFVCTVQLIHTYDRQRSCLPVTPRTDTNSN